MDFTAFLEGIRASRHYQDQIVYVHKIPRRDADYGKLSEPLPDELISALASVGISDLYTHQVSAIEAVCSGKNIVVVTSTASGKTLCYNLPVLKSLLKQGGTPTDRGRLEGTEKSTAFYLFPTKALAQDQLRGLRRYADLEPSLARVMRAGTYDGDTPPNTRRKLRDEASIILTNPDMLHQGILPYHTRWARFFSALKYVVIDEIHTYRGIFGSNVANVLRRLARICRHYGSNPQFICSSATIANPVDLAQRLTGVPMTLIENDGSPRGAKQFVLWNPPCIDVGSMERRSSNVEAQRLMVDLMEAGVRTVTFGRARIVAELMYKYVRDALRPPLAEKVRAYRGGYLPEERREIERQLFTGELIGITSTNALELGIDIGGLDAAIIVGFPGTIASTWQQAGRAGRSVDESLVVFTAYNDPIDQYLMRHPTYFFGQSPENAIVDPENPYILAHHLRCAAFELPVKERDGHSFGGSMSGVAGALAESGDLKEIDDTFYWAKTDFPAADVNLRTISDNTFTIVDISGPPEPNTENPTPSPAGRVIGQVDSISAPELVYPQAIYMHDAETYFVEELDMQNKVAYVRPANVDYYTQAILDASIRINGQMVNGPSASKPLTINHQPSTMLHLGAATVTWQTTGFKKIKFYSLDSIGYGKVDIPPQHLETMSFWTIPSAEVLSLVKNPVEGLMGIRNLMVHVLPLFAMCDKMDIGGIVDSSNTGSPTIFIYDRYTGGLGFAEKGFEMADEVMRACLEMLEECECEAGCPSCVGVPILRPPIHTDPDIFGAFPIPDKAAALTMLRKMLG
ncbi:MAG TPA: DEAD/DEAH box helicase [Armatimonadota bacterium]|nr:DEAD/DEAH box helicase [Armatimonadota bacterium]